MVSILSREMVQIRDVAIREAVDLMQIPGIVAATVAAEEGRYSLRVPRNALGILRSRGLLPKEPAFAYHTPITQPLVLQQPLYAHQRVALERATSRGSMLLGDQMGLGKQQPVDALVMTPQGWREIGTLQVGDQVVGSDGRPTRVNAVYPQGFRQNYRLYFSDGSSVEAGLEHLWTFRYLMGGKRWVDLVLTTADLVRGEVQSPAGKRLDLRKTPLHLPMLSRPLDFPHSTDLPIQPYTLGQMLGNGHHPQARLATAIADWEHVSRRISREGYVCKAMRYGNVVQATIPAIRPALDQLGLRLTLSRDKRVPQVYKTASSSQRLALLQGLMDTDGSCSKTGSRVTFHSTSIGLAQDVQEIVEGLGGIASVKTYVRADKPTEYVVRVRLPPECPPFSLPRKLERYAPGSHARPMRTFVRAEFSRVAESVCIAVDAVDALYVTEHCILTHNTRTAIATAAAVAVGGKSVLIVGPKYVESVWRAEITALGLDMGGFWAARGTQPNKHQMPRGTTWIFCHYDILRYWWNPLSFTRFAAVIFDEGHLAKNPRSARGKAALLVTPGTAVRMVLTGTPVQNNLTEAHALLTLASGPGTWGRELDFRRRYAGATPGEYGWINGPPSNIEELQMRLDDVYLRRDVSVLEDKLPERVRRKVDVELPEASARKVKALLAGYSPAQILDAIRKGQGGKDTIAWLTRMRRATSQAKFSTTVELANSILAQGDSVLIFAWQREMVERIAIEVAGRFVHGVHAQAHRDEVVERWRTSPEALALVATYGTLSTGVTLTKANHVIFHDLDMVPANMLQAEARVYRIGATRPVQSWWPVAHDTLDPFIFSLVNRKAPATAVFGDLGTGELGDFFGNGALDKEIEALLEWSLHQTDQE